MTFGKKHPYMTLFQNQSGETKYFKNGCHFHDATTKILIVPFPEVDG